MLPSGTAGAARHTRFGQPNYSRTTIMPHHGGPAEYGTHKFGRRPTTAATRAKISAALTGKPHPHLGHHPTNVTKAKESAAHTGHPHPHKGHKGPHKHGWHKAKHGG
jgi:hypothetical protein